MRILFWVYLAFCVISLTDAPAKLSQPPALALESVIAYAFTGFGMLGFYGLVYNRKFFTRPFWRNFLIATIAYTVFSTLKALPGMREAAQGLEGDAASPIVYALAVVFFLVALLPIYAVFAYVYRRPALWAEQPAA